MGGKPHTAKFDTSGGPNTLLLSQHGLGTGNGGVNMHIFIIIIVLIAKTPIDVAHHASNNITQPPNIIPPRAQQPAEIFRRPWPQFTYAVLRLSAFHTQM
jgi:hypothetical protein